MSIKELARFDEDGVLEINRHKMGWVKQICHREYTRYCGTTCPLLRIGYQNASEDSLSVFLCVRNKYHLLSSNFK